MAGEGAGNRKTSAQPRAITGKKPKASPTKGNTAVRSVEAKGTGAPARTGSVSFHFDAPNATDVALGGSFNSWSLRTLKRRKDGIWSVTLRLAPGTYEYKFLVDDQWVTDPENPNRAPDPYGGYNSVRLVPSRSDR